VTQQVMDNTWGNALALQLDGMIKALAPFDHAAGEAGDEQVLKLIARLYDAHAAASEIATRQPLASKGVILTRN
jgi:hypothetical protein